MLAQAYELEEQQLRKLLQTKGKVLCVLYEWWTGVSYYSKTRESFEQRNPQEHQAIIETLVTMMTDQEQIRKGETLEAFYQNPIEVLSRYLTPPRTLVLPSP